MNEPTLAFHKVLVIDDDSFMLDLVEALLNRMGINNIKLANSGHTGLEFLTRCRKAPDIIICDLQMPGMDGIEVILELSAQNYAGNIILFSGEDARILKTAKNLASAHNLSVIGTLQKPVTYEGMLTVFSQIKAPIQSENAQAMPSVSLPELQEAIEKQQLIPYFQPKINIATHQVVGAETLVRWNHPQRGIIPPMAFIPLAEKFGLIDALTFQMFDQATHFGGLCLQLNHDLKIAVNISMKNLCRSDLPELLIEIALRNNFPAANIILEVTETSLMQNFALTLEILTRLRLKGIGLSIDDFGTGYSSMEQLKQIPFSELKIDYSFVHDAQHDMTARAILESSVTLAKKLGMSVVAEGVENQSDWDLVSKLNCDQAQGFWMAKPMPAEEFISWSENWNLNPKPNTA